MKLLTQESTYNGKTKTDIIVRKYNADKDQGLTPNEYIYGKFTFQPKRGMATVKKDTQYRKAGDQFPYFFAVAEWYNVPDNMKEHMNEYNNFNFNLGSCRTDDDFTAEDEFMVSLKPFMTKDGARKTFLSLVKVTKLTPRQYKLAVFARKNELDYTDTIDVKQEDGSTAKERLSELIPHWAMVADLFTVEELTEKQESL